MVALYESLLYPLVIMFALPVAVVGALVGLFLAGQTLNISSMIGMVMLMGLVGKNGILLVDYTNTLRQLGKGRFEAIVEAGTTRLRPILMTTMTMVMAMVPVAFFGGPGSEVRSPMAVAVMGGLISSMLLTLVLVPVVYTLLDDLQLRLTRRASTTPRYDTSAGRQLATEGISPMADPSFGQHRVVDAWEEGMAGGQKTFWGGDRASKR
jgi:hydrophobic/amphiphilic exporter-1 (mainly G- bacteria), HAE1 family